MRYATKVSWMSRVLLPFPLACLSACGGGGSGQNGSFRLLQFLEQGQNAIPRNRVLTFLFSGPVAPSQDFFQRLKIENVDAANFSSAVGAYIVTGDRVTFAPRLPERQDRADSGFRESAHYHVFLKAGPDALQSTGGDRVARAQEYLFDTSEFFEDPVPNQPPRATMLLARDPTNGQATDLSRVDPRPQEIALLDSDALLQQGRAIDPGGGGAPGYATPWVFELHVTEALDPATVTPDEVELLQIREDALAGATTADPGHVGDPVLFKVPILVQMVQRTDDAGELQLFIRVQPIETLVDDARYRLSFSGAILGIDFRKTFTGDNGLTGDDDSETGGLGYVTEFLVYDRPAITASRTITYDPLADGIEPEMGQTTNDESLYNTALYDPSFDPGKAVGKISDFGDGADGNLAVSGGGTWVIDTGDTPNLPSGMSVTVTDLDFADSYPNQGLPTSGQRTLVVPTPLTLQLENLTVSASSTLRIVGTNPCRILVRGQVLVNGTLDAGGSEGTDGSLKLSPPGAGGPGGFGGGRSPKGDKSCTLYGGNSCSSFDGFLNICPGAKAWFPFALKGEGPGRGNQGGDSIPYWAQFNSGGVTSSGDNTGTGGGGGSHATSGGKGEDRINAGGTPGSAGPSCSIYGTPNSSVLGARGEPGPTYGDRSARDWIGGSGGGGGGSVGEHAGAIGAYGTSGGSGGGGGGFLEIVASGAISVIGGGKISVAGGAGGAGYFEANVSPQYGTTYQSSWNTVSGGGGGGAGGTISLVSGGDISIVGGLLDARGGAGGAAANTGGLNNGGCNAGGAGGRGFLYVMDVDGAIAGLGGGSLPAGQYDSFTYGVLTVSQFDLSRFGGIAAITEMFRLPAADPDYEPIASGDILANVSAGQRIRIYASSAKADPVHPLQPDVATETPRVEVALVHFVSGATAVDITGDMNNLNPAGTPDRDAFTRINATFEYDNGIEAATGPFAFVDSVTVRFTFNG
jgi:hypothetical protein